MSVILKAPSGADIQVNWWHWRPTMLLVRHALQLDDRRFEMLQLNGVGASLSSSEAQTVAEHLDRVLADFPKDGRLLLDGAVTQTPDSGEFHRDDFAKNYSASYSWLAKFRDFCRDSGGFTVL